MQKYKQYSCSRAIHNLSGRWKVGEDIKQTEHFRSSFLCPITSSDKSQYHFQASKVSRVYSYSQQTVSGCKSDQKQHWRIQRLLFRKVPQFLLLCSFADGLRKHPTVPLTGRSVCVISQPDRCWSSIAYSSLTSVLSSLKCLNLLQTNAWIQC